MRLLVFHLYGILFYVHVDRSNDNSNRELAARLNALSRKNFEDELKRRMNNA